MKRKNILKEAGVLLIGALLIFSSVAAIATTNYKTDLTIPSSMIDTPIRNTGLQSLETGVILWDNYIITWHTGYHSQDDPPDEPEQWDSFVADDFMFEEETDVNWVFWQFVYGWCNNMGGPRDFHYDWNITFFEDDGTGYHPGDIFAGPFTIVDADIYKSLPYVNTTEYNGQWSCGAYAFLPAPVTFNADTKYWISIYSTGPIFPQTFWYVHNESHGGILLHEGNFKSIQWGYPNWINWTNFSIVDEDKEKLDANFVLGGDPPFEVTISKGLGVTATIISKIPPDPEANVTNLTVTFTATGGFVLSRTKTVVIAEFEAGATETVKWFPIGFGSIAIDVACTSNEVGIRDADTTGFLILFFLL
ncbi:MAG: hypothetical protein JSW06_10065 [Thermoplasmatales archaeon]|nr:MAG: hypothetical protein JSW06_10065 [Thermoplasmatales archaeon]